MQLSYEIPIKYLDTLGQYNDFNFTLAHLASNAAYAAYYRKTKKYTICDNSAFELSYPLPAADVVNAAHVFGAQEIIAPDALNDGKGTIKATEAFIDYMRTSGNLGKFKIMGVVQGANVPDWISCLTYLNNHEDIDVLGFSYIGCKSFNPADLANARIKAVQLATHPATANVTKPIHLLGVGSNPLEILLQSKVPNVRSCDTSLPIVQGYYNNKLDKTAGLIGNKLSRPGDYFDLSLNPAQLTDIIFNVGVMKSWAN